MKIVCSREKLVEGISIVQRAVASRSTIAILDGILIEVGEQIVLTGYNMENGIEYNLPGDISEKGSVVVKARTFGDIIRKLPEEVVTLEVDSNYLVKIESGSAKFTIKGQDAADYPKIPLVEADQNILIKQNLLKDMIRQVIFSISTDDSQPIFKGVFFKSDQEKLEVVAIDKYRLALRRLFFTEEDRMGEFSFLVPGKALAEVGKILSSDDEEQINIVMSSNHILFKTEQVNFVSRLIAGNFLDYESLFTKQIDTEITVSPQLLAASVERATLLIDSADRSSPVKLVTNDQDRISLSARSEIGELREEVSARIEGKEVDVDLNPKYFMEALKVIDEDEVLISINGNLGPCIITPIDSKEFVYLVMALRR